MTRRKIAATVALHANMPAAYVERVIRSWVATVQRELIFDGQFSISGLGRFKVQTGKVCRNLPRHRNLPAVLQKRISFAASRELKKRLKSARTHYS